MSRFAVILVLFSLALPIIKAQDPGTSPDAENKCGGCPCDKPCPVPPPPPPPVLPPPPPPPPKKPPTPICPPPPASTSWPTVPTPPSQYIYTTGPPGNLYPLDTDFSGAVRSFNTVGLAIFFLIIGSILELVLW
ncbi:hypothetical protein ACH5RR_036317 [Cinchona calisaya]|uniref:Uncharacterized protein n=1 Tax=Cinchona calisaya TaxID=153742 RepID=A0ABD2Y300_9GENT